MDAFVASFLREYFDLLYKNFDPKRDMTVRLAKGEIYVGPMRTYSGQRSPDAQRARTVPLTWVCRSLCGLQAATIWFCANCSATRRSRSRTFTSRNALSTYVARVPIHPLR